MGLRGPVLAATDLSEAADAALGQGRDLAAALGAPFIVCHVLPEAYRVRVLFPQDAGIDTAAQADIERKAREVLQQRLESLFGRGSGSVEIDTGTAHAGILAVVERVGAGVVVLGPGRTAQRVARSAAGPVLIARPSPTGGSVLGATDFSDPSLPAVRLAGAEARRRRVKLRLLHCLDVDSTSYLAPAGAPGMMPLPPAPQSMIDEMAASARGRLEQAAQAAGVTADVEVALRPPALGIVEAAQTTVTSLVVVGTRGRTGLSRLALGSVAEDVMSHAPCSVLVVPLHPEG